MEQKKSKKANLEKKRILFFEIALILVLSFVYCGFQWAVDDVRVKEVGVQTAFIEEEMALPDMKVEKPKIQETKLRDFQIEVVPDDEDIDEDEDPIFTTDVDVDEEIPIMDMPKEEDEATIFVNVAKMPQYPGGIKKMYEFINSKIQYPSVAAESDIQGTVFLKFVVSKNGMVSKVQVVRGVDPTLNREAVRVVRMLPRFIPGEQRGKKVNVWYQLPVKFKLN